MPAEIHQVSQLEGQAQPLQGEETDDPHALRMAVLAHLESQGFRLNDQGLLMQAPKGKDAIRQLHTHAVEERRNTAKKHLAPKEPRLLRMLANTSDIVADKIQPRLTIIENRTSVHADLWRWASLHWSIPVSSGYGRRIRFLVTDRNHGDALIGIIGLGDPVFALAARDAYIDWRPAHRRERLACVMDAFVLGAVPPYNELLGSKLIALLATSSEVQEIFREKYGNRVTLIGRRNPDAELALLTTTSALGKSSVYNRLTSPSGGLAYVSVGWTAGSGDFHLSGELYHRLAKYAHAMNPDGKTERHERWTGNNSFRNRREVVHKALDALGLPGRRLRVHGIQRQIYVAPLGLNSLEYLRGEHSELHRSTYLAEELADYWRERWAVPRSARISPQEFYPDQWALWPVSQAQQARTHRTTRPGVEVD
jgi:hypothetical protein